MKRLFNDVWRVLCSITIGRKYARADEIGIPFCVTLDEDTLTMAYEASVSALAGAEAPGTVITVSQSPPFGLRKLSATLARA